MNPQILIVGAGPVGMTLALELARYGVKLRIIDKAPARTDKSKALVLWSRTLELLDRSGCTQDFVAAGQKMVAANIIAGGTQIGHVAITNVESPYPYALMLPQSDTERLLEDQLARRGITVERNVEALSFASHIRAGTGDSVTANLRLEDGSEDVVTADWLVGCDGAHSLVRHGLKLSFDGDTLLSDWLLADLHLTGYPFAENEMATWWHESGVLVIFPIAPGRFRVIADLGLSAGGTPEAPALALVQAVIDRRGPPGLKVSDPVWLAAFRINERKVKHYRLGRVFVAGDAAHVHSPAGGQGMNTGMQDAFNLAWKLALVCKGVCQGRTAETLLDSYSVERSAVGDTVLKAAGRLTAIAVLRNQTLQELRNLAARMLLGLAPFRDRMVETMTEVSIGYPKSPLNGKTAPLLDGPHPGERVAPVAGMPPFGAGDQPRFALCAPPDADTGSLTRRFPDLLEPEIRAPLGGNGLWLVRPDGYVACTAGHDDAETIAAYLGSLQDTRQKI